MAVLQRIRDWWRGKRNASKTAVWCLDPGHTALKALHCRLSDSQTMLVADKFEYIEYPKALCRPDADPEQLLGEALQQFRALHKVEPTDAVALSLPGINGLIRFFRPPPIDVKKLPDIVGFEMRQQCPFPLDEVVWGHQVMPGAIIQDGFTLDTEIGLFALKKDLVEETLLPFVSVGLKPDLVQLNPIALANFLALERLSALTAEYDHDHPEPFPFTVLLSVGTRDSDVVISNGYRMYARNIPMGGDNFTRELAKRLNLTLDKAEHLKRNYANSDAAEAVTGALIGVADDLRLELDRTIGFFLNTLYRGAKIDRFVGLGNGLLAPGLLKRLCAKDPMTAERAFDCPTALGHLVHDFGSDAFFRSRISSFAVLEGLAAQWFGLAPIQANLAL